MDYNTFLTKYREVAKARKAKKGGLLNLVGSMSEKETTELNRTMDKMCENIDPEMWK